MPRKWTKRIYMTYTLYNKYDKGVLLYHEKTHLNDRLEKRVGGDRRSIRVTHIFICSLFL